MGSSEELVEFPLLITFKKRATVGGARRMFSARRRLGLAIFDYPKTVEWRKFNLHQVILRRYLSRLSEWRGRAFHSGPVLLSFSFIHLFIQKILTEYLPGLWHSAEPWRENGIRQELCPWDANTLVKVDKWTVVCADAVLVLLGLKLIQSGVSL